MPRSTKRPPRYTMSLVLVASKFSHICTFMHVPLPGIGLSSISLIILGQMDGNKVRCDCSMFVVKSSLY
jgi:hypothetical protein